MDDLLQDFLTETAENLAEIDNDLVAFEHTPDNPELIRNIFRLVHTIKGTCGFIGLVRLGEVAHAAENVLGAFRDGKLAGTADSIGVVLDAIDCIKVIVAGIAARGEEPPGNDKGLIARLDAILTGEAAPPPPEGPSQPPEPEDSADRGGGDRPSQQTAPPPGGSPAPADRPGGKQTLRVSIALLESLMTTVSELVLTRNQLVQTLRDMDAANVTVPLQRLSQIVSDLQDGVMKTRMQPIGDAWRTLPRTIRDLARELGKKIDLQLLGAETEVDRQILEIIKDPLIHMIRNSADHGLETPAARRAAGKPETGRITVRACHQGGHIVIDVADDGSGLDVAGIRKRAVAKGLASEAAAAQLSDAQVHRFIFDPGFSTAAQVTSVSGRGVGLDVVRSNVEKIGGSIELRSVEGAGTTFIIRIPLTLAIAAALIIETAGERFAVPQLAVREVVMVSPTTRHRIETINGAPLLRLRDRLLPVAHLSQALQIAEAPPREETFVLVLQAGGQVFGIAVDRVLDTEEIVIKPVARILQNLSVYAGNTILGDGNVVMILDPNGLAGLAINSMMGPTGIAGAPADAIAESATSAVERSLVFETRGEGLLCAVPLSRIERIENLDLASVERSAGRRLIQYRGALMPLVEIDPDTALLPSGTQPTLVFCDTQGAFGIIVGRIVDVAEADLTECLPSPNPVFAGTAIVAGRATEIVDVERIAVAARGTGEGTAAAALPLAA